MPVLDDRSNFVYATVVGGYDAVQTSIQIDPVMWARLPSPVGAGFNLTWWNRTGFPSHAEDPDAEIVRVTGTTFPDLITVIRGQEGRPASAKNLAGKTYRMILGTTKKMIDDIEGLANSKSTDYFWRFKAFPANVFSSAGEFNGNIAYGNGVHIVCGQISSSLNGPRILLRSTDGGEAWAAAPLPLGSPDIIHRMAFGAGVFIGINSSITASHQPIIRSTDGGLTFAPLAMTLPSGSNSQAEIFYVGDRFLIFTLNSQVLSSVDGGLTWVLGTMPSLGVQSGHLWRDVASAGGVYLAVATATGPNNAARSIDGLAWAFAPTPMPTTGLDQLHGIIHAGSRFIITTASTAPIATSVPRLFLQTTDGLAYTLHNAAFNAAHGRIAKVNDIYVTCSRTVGHDGQISRTGNTWKRQEGSTLYNVTSIAVSPNRLVATVVVGVATAVSPLGVLIMDVPP